MSEPKEPKIEEKLDDRESLISNRLRGVSDLLENLKGIDPESVKQEDLSDFLERLRNASDELREAINIANK